MKRQLAGWAFGALAAGVALWATCAAWAAWAPALPAGDVSPVVSAAAPTLAVPAGRVARAHPTLPAPRPLPVARNDGNGNAALEIQIAAARRGDAQAALAAYRGLAACVQPDGPGCPGLPASLLQERVRFLAQAVRAGLPGAQLDFYFEGPDLMQTQDEQALQAWRTEALAGLQAAAARCEPLAAGVLATLYDSGELAPRDPSLAVAYAVAEGRWRGRGVSDASLRDRLAEPIDDAALAAARQQGLALAAACR